MEPILYWYPVVYLDEDDPEDRVIVRESGKITPIQLSQEPYEVNVAARGSSFHLIFGSQINGMFLCIPNWNVGCELSRLSDRDWNMNSLRNCSEPPAYCRTISAFPAKAAVNAS